MSVYLIRNNIGNNELESYVNYYGEILNFSFSIGVELIGMWNIKCSDENLTIKIIFFI